MDGGGGGKQGVVLLRPWRLLLLLVRLQRPLLLCVRVRRAIIWRRRQRLVAAAASAPRRAGKLGTIGIHIGGRRRHVVAARAGPQLWTAGAPAPAPPPQHVRKGGLTGEGGRRSGPKQVRL